MADGHRCVNAPAPSPFEWANSTVRILHWLPELPRELHSSAHSGDGLNKAPFIICLLILFSLPHFPIAVSWDHLINKLYALRSLTQVLPLGPNPRQGGD